MAYTKLPLIDNETLIDKDLLDHIQDGIVELSEIADIKTDNTLTLSAERVLSVNTATPKDRTLPIKASDVDVVVGNIGALLETI